MTWIEAYPGADLYWLQSISSVFSRVEDESRVGGIEIQQTV